jgi:hypothetical protein
MALNILPFYIIYKRDKMKQCHRKHWNRKSLRTHRSLFLDRTRRKVKTITIRITFYHGLCYLFSAAAGEFSVRACQALAVLSYQRNNGSRNTPTLARPLLLTHATNSHSCIWALKLKFFLSCQSDQHDCALYEAICAK